MVNFMKNIKDYEAMVKLELSETERRLVYAGADMLTDSFRRLEDIDISGVEPLVTVLNIKNIFREDACKKTLLREELLAGAPERYDGYFQVPKTLD